MATELSRRHFVAAAAVAGAAVPMNGPAITQAQAQTRNAPKPPSPYRSGTGERSLVIGSLDELEAKAAKVIPPGAFAFIASGADNQWTLRENSRAFQDIKFHPRYLVGKTAPNLSTTLLGEKLSLPIITAPMGAIGLAHASAELGAARGTGQAGTLMTVSTAANKTIEEIAAATNGPKWFQLYLHDDRAPSRELLRRAKAAGYTAIVFTIDAFAPGASDETVRQSFSFPPGLTMVNSGTPFFKKSLSWDDVSFIKDTTDLPVILKGVISPDIAEKGIERGVAGIQVSNHGGRGLDGIPAAINLLPAVVDAVKGRVPVIMDSGIRRGTDVFKALALGANAVALGRPVLYGLALGGSMGVKSVYDRIRDELTRAMLIAGVANIGEINKDYIVK